MRIRNESVLSATRRLAIPARRRAQAVSTRPPAPLAAKIRDAARPAIVICGLAPADPGGAALGAHEHAAEHHHVAAEHADREHERQEHPVRAAVLDPVPRVVEACELRKQVVHGGDRGEQEAAERKQVARRELEPRRGLGLVVVGLATGLKRRARRLVERSAPPCGHVPHASARASAAWTAADTWRASGAATGASRAHTLGQREPGHEIDDVMLAQVDERGPEQRRVGPADRARRCPSRPVRARPRRMSRSAGGHGCERVSPETPYRGAQPDRQKCSPYSTIILRSQASARPPSSPRPPRTRVARSGPPSSR